MKTRRDSICSTEQHKRKLGNTNTYNSCRNRFGHSKLSDVRYDTI